MHRYINKNVYERLSFQTDGLERLLGQKQLFICRNQMPSDHLLALGPKGNCTFYEIIDSFGRRLYDAIETKKSFARRCCRDLHSFELSLLQCDNQAEVLRFQRPFRGDCCFCFGFLQAVDIIVLPDISIIGRIMQDWTICRPHFQIKLPGGETLFHIAGACCTMRCCVRELDFDITNEKLAKTAKISSQWTGLLRDEFENEQFFGVEFKEKNIDTRVKAFILGACFLVNALYYRI